MIRSETGKKHEYILLKHGIDRTLSLTIIRKLSQFFCDWEIIRHEGKIVIFWGEDAILHFKQDRFEVMLEPSRK